MDLCPGVCVVDQFAEYCEAWLTTVGMCETGLKCCVPPELYGDQIPDGLKILKSSNRLSLHEFNSTLNHSITALTTTVSSFSLKYVLHSFY